MSDQHTTGLKLNIHITAIPHSNKSSVSVSDFNGFGNYYAVALVDECTLDRAERIVHLIVDAGACTVASFATCRGEHASALGET